MPESIEKINWGESEGLLENTAETMLVLWGLYELGFRKNLWGLLPAAVGFAALAID